MSTLVVYSDTTDGYIASNDSHYNDGDGEVGGDYASARAGTGVDHTGAAAPPVADSTSTIVTTGQYRSSVLHLTHYDYTVYESFLSFDTSSIGSGTVSAAVLNLSSQVDNSLTDFTIEARAFDWGTGLTTDDWVAGANLSSQTLLAHYATSGGWDVLTAYDFADDALPANINKTGSTRLLLCSDHTTSSTAPTGYEYANAYSADQTGTTRDPKLTVTFTAGGGTLFLMLEDNSGSYELEDGSGGTLLEA